MPTQNYKVPLKRKYQVQTPMGKSWMSWLYNFSPIAYIKLIKTKFTKTGGFGKSCIKVSTSWPRDNLTNVDGGGGGRGGSIRELEDCRNNFKSKQKKKF
jgi:hypothetical protein